MASWQLTYADGSKAGPLPGMAESISSARPGAIALTIMDGERALRAIRLDGSKDRPIFYRIRAMDALGPGALGTPYTLAEVFGRGTPDGSECDLWALRDGEIVSCPPELFSESGIRTCLGIA